MIFLDTEKISDPNVRENMEKISEVLNSNPFASGKFTIFEIDVTNTTSVIKFKHNLKFIPTDVFVSWVNPTSTINVRYDLIDKEYITFTSTAKCRVRIVVGRGK